MMSNLCVHLSVYTMCGMGMCVFTVCVWGDAGGGCYSRLHRRISALRSFQRLTNLNKFLKFYMTVISRHF